VPHILMKPFPFPLARCRGLQTSEIIAARSEHFQRTSRPWLPCGVHGVQFFAAVSFVNIGGC